MHVPMGIYYIYTYHLLFSLFLTAGCVFIVLFSCTCAGQENRDCHGHRCGEDQGEGEEGETA